MTKEQLLDYIAERFSVEPDYPWERLAEGYVCRHPDNRKWFLVGMPVACRHLGIDRDGVVDVVDVKTGPLLQGAYRTHPGILPGYHMNKAHWVTIMLDGSAEDDVIRELLEVSWELTRDKRRKAPPADDEALKGKGQHEI